MSKLVLKFPLVFRYSFPSCTWWSCTSWPLSPWTRPGSSCSSSSALSPGNYCTYLTTNKPSRAMRPGAARPVKQTKNNFCDQGVTRRCHLSWLTKPSYTSPNGGGGGMGRGVLGSQPMSTAVHITWHGAQTNFGDLTPYLTCVCDKPSKIGRTLPCTLGLSCFIVNELNHFLLPYYCNYETQQILWDCALYVQFGGPELGSCDRSLERCGHSRLPGTHHSHPHPSLLRYSIFKSESLGGCGG